MSASGLDPARLDRLDEVMAGFVDRDEVGGLTWLVARGPDVHVGTAGVLVAGGDEPVRRDSIFRISSMTKPLVAATALALVEDTVLRLDDPVDDLLPELADRQVLVDPAGPLDRTVPAERAITLRDLLTFRLGWGMDFAATSPQATIAAMAELELGAGPPAPAELPPPDEWLRRLGTLPLDHQPGERWLYNTGADVLGALVARAAGRPLGEVVAERLLEPLGMADTGFWVPPGSLDRFGACHAPDPETGERTTYDPPDGQWASPPAFPSGAGGMVSTVDDLHAFARMLLAGGALDGVRVLSPGSVAAMTTNHLTDAQLAVSGPSPDGSVGWGFGVGVGLRRTGPTFGVGSYGWNGGLGSTWSNDPESGLIGIELTTESWLSPEPPTAAADFWTSAFAAVA